MDKQTRTDIGGNEMKIYHTETQADYDSLMVELEEQGAKWSSGTNPTETNHWSEFKRQTGIRLQNCILTYHGVGYYERVNPETPIIKYTVKKETIAPEETTTMSFEEVMVLVENDMIDQPPHYVGEQGLEVEVVLQNFIPRYDDPYVGHRIASAIEYLLRSPLKNRRQDIEKAGKNIQQALAYLDMTDELK